MGRIAGFTTQKTFVGQGVLTLEAATGGTVIYTGTEANACFVRFTKHASQAGGETPIAYLSYSLSNKSPVAADSMPIYHGDSFWIWPEELKGVSVASSDANFPTVYYALWLLQ